MNTRNTIRADTSSRHQNKYENRNPLQRLALDRFFDAVAAEISDVKPHSTFELGCGEGYFYRHLVDRGVDFGVYDGIDLREDAIAQARVRNPGVSFEVANLFDLRHDKQSFDLVIAAEVLEHLPNPDPYLARLTEICSRRLLLTVPHEPWFMLLNLLRGRDILRFGNHPEHVNHWNAMSFPRYVERFARVRRTLRAFPFVIVVADV